ncbi:MAG TPA: phosphatase PAP2 family protein [Aquabacterium sp.]|nr:phosphatase PAP2 family protein [Aquabacterium sp.]
MKQTLTRWRRNFELRLLWPLGLAAAALWGFLGIADEMMEGEVHAADAWILALCRTGGAQGGPWGPLWLPDVMRDITALGSPTVLILTVTAIWGYLAMARQWRMAWLAAGSCLGGWATSIALKQMFMRSRPDVSFHGTLADGYSFPSGHAMMSAVVFLTLATLVARLAPRTRLRVYAIGVAALVSGLVGLSRVYLGVHWASDVAAGWAAGVAWALLVWALAHLLHLGQEASQ